MHAESKTAASRQLVEHYYIQYIMRRRQLANHRWTTQRRGYALVLVFVFVVLFLGLLGIAWRHIASALRMERVIEIRRECDEGSVRVLALAMQVLETRLCWDTANNVAKIKIADDDYRSAAASFSCKKYFNASSDAANPNWHYYQVAFIPASAVGTSWTVRVNTSTETGVLGLPDLPANPP
jgi:hypothetical protein